MNMSDIHERLPAKPWAAMDETEREEAARLLQAAATDAFEDMVREVNRELYRRECPLRVGGRLVVTWETL